MKQKEINPNTRAGRRKLKLQAKHHPETLEVHHELHSKDRKALIWIAAVIVIIVALLILGPVWF